MANAIMKGSDAISAKLAECFITIKGRRYNFGNIIDFEAPIEKNKVEVPILGKLMTSHKTVGMSGTFTGTMHYNQSIFRQLLIDYKNTGVDTYFEIQITNEDPQTELGRQTLVLKQCNLDGGMLTKFDADGEYLEEDIDGTFEDFTMPEKFKELLGL